MRGSFPYRGRAAVVVLGFLFSAAVIDRIAVVVGSSVITESEVQRELRLTEFVNGQPLDLGPQQRRAAADRLVDQDLIRHEMQVGNYPMPPASDADKLLAGYRRQHSRTDAQLRASLRKYGLTEDDLKQHLLWEEAVLKFTDMRFQPNLPGAPVQSANRLRPGAPAPAHNVDEQLDAWLKQQRANIRIQFKPEAFQ